VVVALEAMAAAQALELRAPLRPATGTAAATKAVREAVPFLARDREIRLDIEATIDLIRSGALVAAVEQAVERLS